jgi:hypothetical protein
MSIYFVDHVTTYRKYCKTGKGKILEGLLLKFENILMMEEAFKDFKAYISQFVNKLNEDYPKTKKFIVEYNGNFYIRPEGSRSFETDYVAIIGIKNVKATCYTSDLQNIFRNFNDSLDRKGGNDD